jgi:hypothetical protein
MTSRAVISILPSTACVSILPPATIRRRPARLQVWREPALRPPSADHPFGEQADSYFRGRLSWRRMAPHCRTHVLEQVGERDRGVLQVARVRRTWRPSSVKKLVAMSEEVAKAIEEYRFRVRIGSTPIKVAVIE